MINNTLRVAIEHHAWHAAPGTADRSKAVMGLIRAALHDAANEFA